jgi:Uma2 family endonuclease
MAPALPPAAPAPAAVPTLPIYRLSVAQYHAMIRHGILVEGDRVELIHGWLVPKMTKNPPHTTATGLVSDALAPLVAGWHVRPQEPITLSESEPEPDVVVARGSRRDYTNRHPGPRDVGLVVEVAESSLEQDRNVMGPVYAREGIAVYWIVNLVDHQLEVHTDPSGACAQPDYATRQVFGPADEVPVVNDGVEVGRIAVRDLLP